MGIQVDDRWLDERLRSLEENVRRLKCAVADREATGSLTEAQAVVADARALARAFANGDVSRDW